MSKREPLGWYLAGGMENEARLGADWREKMEEFLVGLGFKVYNPVEFEPHQLRYKHINRLPKSIKVRKNFVAPQHLYIDDENIKVTHWHHLKYAEPGTHEHNRFLEYMKLVKNYDKNLVRSKVDCMVVYWSASTSKGAGTHVEADIAEEKGIPIYCVLDHTDIPGWNETCYTKICFSFEELMETIKDDFSE